MADHFTPHQKISAKTADTDRKVTTVDGEVHRVVREFDFPKLREPGGGDYSKIKARFGPLAATDDEKQAKSRKDGRFTVNPLLRDPLLIEDEERRVIQQRVHEGVEQLAEEAKKTGYNDGLAIGSEKGHLEAMAKYEAEAGALMARFTGLIEEFEGAKVRIFRESERMVLEAMSALVRKTVIRELQTDADYLSRLAGQIIERTGARDQIRIRINPTDLAQIGKLRAELLTRFGAMQNLTIEASEDVTGGGCVVETDWSVVDASLDTQLQAIHEELVKDHRNHLTADAEGSGTHEASRE